MECENGRGISKLTEWWERKTKVSYLPSILPASCSCGLVEMISVTVTSICELWLFALKLQFRFIDCIRYLILVCFDIGVFASWNNTIQQQ